MYQNNRSKTLPRHHDAARNMYSTIRASYVGALSRTLAILLAELEISSYTQVKNRVCARCMAEQTGVHDVIFHAEGQAYVSDHALELILPILMPP